MITEQRVPNLVLDNTNIRSIHLNKAAKPPGGAKRPHREKSWSEVVNQVSEQPLISFHTSFEREQHIKDKNGFRTTKTVYAKAFGGGVGGQRKAGDDAVALEIAKDHKDARLHFITNQAKPKPNSSSQKHVIQRYDGKHGQKQPSWKEGEAHWKPKALLPYLQPTFTVILGESRGKKDYFRAFTTAVPKPVNQTDRASQLLPHRMKKTMRLYGVSPLVLLKKAKYRKPAYIKAKQIPENPLAVAPAALSSKEKHNIKIKRNWCRTKKIAKNDDKPIDTRVNGVEIAPNFSEANEFDFADGDIMFEHTEQPLEDGKGQEDEIIEPLEMGEVVEKIDEMKIALSTPLPDDYHL